MYCFNGNCYLPQPPRDWSRVQNSCSLITASTVNQFVQVPYTGEIIPSASLGYKLAMINKGNVLQYKKNSSNLTKLQKYSQIAKGQWVNRTKTWATQSTRGYTNPNNMSLIRSGGENVTLAGVPTTLPVTCPFPPINNNNVLPPTGGGGTSTPPLPPPPPPPSNSGGTVIPIIPVPIIEPIVIQDFGNLVCGTFENLCTGEIIQPIKLDNCHPTTDSDVPGKIESLCWNDGNPTFYPRQRYIMTNSTNKWPVNAVLGSAVKPSTPILSIIVVNNIVTLSWTFDFNCLPISRYNIYQDGQLIDNIDGTLRSYTIIINTIGTYSFFITAENNGIISDMSNVVEASITQPLTQLEPLTQTDLLTQTVSLTQLEPISQSSILGTSITATNQLEATNQQKPIKKIAPISKPKPRITTTNISSQVNTILNNTPTFKIINTIPEVGYFEMPPFSNNFDKLVIFNKTTDMLPIKSEYKIFNLLYYRDGEYNILLPPNSHTNFIYVKQNNNIVINASII